MGDPAEPGEDQFTTIIIEGPQKGATKAEVDAYKVKFDQYKADVTQLFQNTWKGGTGLKVRIKTIENKPKGP